jgi:hypothetical protein
MNRNELQIKAEEISKKIRVGMGDRGSCVMGYDFYLDDKQLIRQPAQGSSTCYRVYEDVREMLLSNGVDDSRIRIDYGVMD